MILKHADEEDFEVHRDRNKKKLHFELGRFEMIPQSQVVEKTRLVN